MAFEGVTILPHQGDNIIRTKEAQECINPNGIAHEVYTCMIKHKSKIGQIDAETGKEETFGDILQRSVRVACHLRKLGVTPDDIISPCTTNHLNTSVMFHAILFTGAKVASLDPFAPDEDRIRQLELVKPKFIFAIPEAVGALENMIKKLDLNTKIVVFGHSRKHIRFDDLLTPLPDDEANFTPYIVEDIYQTAFIVFSSGTTGSPKGICVNHYAAMFSLEIGQPQVFLSYASLVWASAIITTLAAATGGHIKVMTSGFECEKTWKYLEKFKITTFFGAPQDLVALMKTGKPAELQLPHLKIVMIAGGALSIDTVITLRQMFPTSFISTAYGQTELWRAAILPDVSPTGLPQFFRKQGTCGKPTNGLTYKIIDTDTGETLGPHQPGELCIKAKSNMNGYYKVDSSDRFDEDGFMKTGDILYYDEDYWFFFVERSKEMLRYKMIAIAPTELEGILIAHPSVKLAVVIGIPTDEGDLVTAVIVKKHDNVTAEELENLVASKVDDRKKLRGGVKFVDENEIPFTPSGKIRRRALREHILKKE